MTIKFGQKPTIRDMAKVVDDRLGRTTGASKGKAPLPKPKINRRNREVAVLNGAAPYHGQRRQAFPRPAG